MYEFLRLQYIIGNITEDQIRSFVPKFITFEESEKIINGE